LEAVLIFGHVVDQNDQLRSALAQAVEVGVGAAAMRAVWVSPHDDVGGRRSSGGAGLDEMSDEQRDKRQAKPGPRGKVPTHPRKPAPGGWRVWAGGNRCAGNHGCSPKGLTDGWRRPEELGRAA